MRNGGCFVDRQIADKAHEEGLIVEREDLASRMLDRVMSNEEAMQEIAGEVMKDLPYECEKAIVAMFRGGKLDKADADAISLSMLDLIGDMAADWTEAAIEDMACAKAGASE